MKTQTAPSIRPDAKITTKALTVKFGAQPQTARASYCRHGHWMGLVPLKLPNGKLLWNDAEADRLLAGEAVKALSADEIAAHIARKVAHKAARLAAGKAAAKLKRQAAVVQAATAGEVAN
jgi:hypothetical protein